MQLVIIHSGHESTHSSIIYYLSCRSIKKKTYILILACTCFKLYDREEKLTVLSVQRQKVTDVTRETFCLIFDEEGFKL